MRNVHGLQARIKMRRKETSLYYGIVGRHISYTRSPEIHTNLWQETINASYPYKVFDTDDLTTFVAEARQDQDLGGFSVTIPYKEAIIPMLDEIAPSAYSVGAVNCVVCDRRDSTPRFIGHNTDVSGVIATLNHCKRLIPKIHHAFILGTGGASKAVQVALQQQGIDYTIVSRHPSPKSNHTTYSKLSEHPLYNQPKIIINATPIGSAHYPHQTPAIDYSIGGDQDIYFDLIYEPSPTPFMMRGLALGIEVHSGLRMLTEQAREAQRLWQEAL